MMGRIRNWRLSILLTKTFFQIQLYNQNLFISTFP